MKKSETQFTRRLRLLHVLAGAGWVDSMSIVAMYAAGRSSALKVAAARRRAERDLVYLKALGVPLEHEFARWRLSRAAFSRWLKNL